MQEDRTKQTHPQGKQELSEAKLNDVIARVAADALKKGNADSAQSQATTGAVNAQVPASVAAQTSPAPAVPKQAEAQVAAPPTRTVLQQEITSAQPDKKITMAQAVAKNVLDSDEAVHPFPQVDDKFNKFFTNSVAVTPKEKTTAQIFAQEDSDAAQPAQKVPLFAKLARVFALQPRTDDEEDYDEDDEEDYDLAVAPVETMAQTQIVPNAVQPKTQLADTAAAHPLTGAVQFTQTRLEPVTALTPEGAVQETAKTAEQSAAPFAVSPGAAAFLSEEIEIKTQATENIFTRTAARWQTWYEAFMAQRAAQQASTEVEPEGEDAQDVQAQALQTEKQFEVEPAQVTETQVGALHPATPETVGEINLFAPAEPEKPMQQPATLPLAQTGQAIQPQQPETQKRGHLLLRSQQKM